MRGSIIFIRARNHVIRFDIETGLYDVADAKFIYRDVPHYNPGAERSILNERLSEWFSLCENTHETLDFFWEAAGRFLISADKCRMRLVLTGGDHSGADVIQRSILAIIGKQSGRKKHFIDIYRESARKFTLDKSDIVFPLWSDAPVVSELAIPRIIASDREMSAIFNLMITGLRRFVRKNSIDIPKDCQIARREIEEKRSAIDSFIEQMTVNNESRELERLKPYWRAYKGHVVDVNAMIGYHRFANIMRGRGYDVHTASDGSLFIRGLSLIT